MASNFIPMLSSSPPPIDDDDCLENDEEDNDFGAFKGVKDVFVCSPLYNSTSNEALESSPKCQPNVISNNVHSENGLNVVQLSVFSSHSLEHNERKESDTSNRTHNLISHNNDSNISPKLPSLNTNPPSFDEDECEISETDSKQNVCFTENCLKACESQKHLPFLNQSEGYLSSAQDISNEAASCAENISTMKEIANTSDEISVGDFESYESGKEIQQVPPFNKMILKQQVVNAHLYKCEVNTAVNGESFVKECNENCTEDFEDQELVKENWNYEDTFKTSECVYTYSGKLSEESKIESESSVLSQAKAVTTTIKSCNICFRNSDSSDENGFERCRCNSSMGKENNKDVESDHESGNISVINTDNYFAVSQSYEDSFEGDETLTLYHDTSDKNLDTSVQLEVGSLTDEFDDFQQAEALREMPEHEFDPNEAMFHRFKGFSDDETSLDLNGFSESFASFPCEHGSYIKEISNVTSDISESAMTVVVSQEKPCDTRHLIADNFGESSYISGNEENECSGLAISESGMEENFANFEAADFASASGSTFSIKEPALQHTVKESERGIEKISKVIGAIYPVLKETCSSNDIEKSDVETWEHNPKSHRLWDKLQEVEHTPGLRFQWGISHSFQMMLRSVNIDYHSILRTSSIPLFASGLSILEPTKGPTSSTTKLEDEGVIQSPKDPIPPVHFDWGSSGLVNPLDSNHVTSTLMDLSFLSSSDAVSSQSSFSADLGLEKELFVTCSASLSTDINNKPPILEQLLSSTAPSSLPDSHQFRRPPNISEEASHVLDQLPDLSFMRAKVLMFPISNIT